MIDNFIIEKLIELIPHKNQHEVKMQNEINQIDFIPRNLNFDQECFRILKKIKKEYANEEIKHAISRFKKQIIAKNEPKDILCTLYLLTKLIKQEEFNFEKHLDSEMAEIDLGISMTSLEIQMEELLNSKLDFDNIKITKENVIKKVIDIEKVNEVEIIAKPKEEQTTTELIKMLAKELQEVKMKVDKTHKIEEQLQKNEIQINGLKNQITNLNSVISKIQEENSELKKDNKEMKAEILSLKSRLKILEDLNKITDSE